MIVLKIGGDIYQKGLKDSLLVDIRKTLETEDMVIVHGGGDEVTSIAQKLGKEQLFVTSPGGIRSRYTDIETIEIFTMVMAGKINKILVQWLIRHDVPAVGLTGIDGKIFGASRKKKLLIIDERNRKRIIDGGFTGKINKVDTKILNLLLGNGYLPVLAPIALGEENEFLNTDADRAAAQVAGALNARKLIFLTDVEGVLIKGEYIKKISLHGAKRILSSVGQGMNKKVIAASEALELGIGEAIISSGLVEDPITSALEHNKGTVIING